MHGLTTTAVGGTTTAAAGAGGNMTAGSAGAGISIKTSRRLILHFDLNKTILMKDHFANLNNSTLTVRNVTVDMIF
jgi:hypothetical protein